MHRRNIPPLLLLAFAAVVWLLAQQRSQSSVLAAALAPAPQLLDSAHQALVDQYETFLLSMRELEPTPAMAVAIVKDNQVIFERAWGVRSVEDNSPVNVHSVFRLASLSKGFAPVLAGIMVEKGKLHWSDPIIQYVPDLRLSNPEYTQTLNLEHVLSHTTGLPRHAYSNLVNLGRPYRQILPMLKNVELAHPPGVFYNYQNVAYSLSGDVLEKVGGKSYSALMEEFVFRPAGMKRASVGFEAMDSLRNKALPHGPDQAGYHPVRLEPDWYTVAPAAGVNASIRDMEKWLLLLLGARPDIISGQTLDKIFTPYVSVSTRESNLRSWRKGLEAAWYALGWRVMDYRGRRIIYHGGYVNGYRTEIAFDRERKIGVVLLSSASASFIGECMPTFFDLYQETIGESGDALRLEADLISRD